MARRVSQRERTQEAHPDDVPLTKRQQLQEDRWSHVPEVLGNDHGRNDDVQVSTKPQFVLSSLTFEDIYLLIIIQIQRSRGCEKREIGGVRESNLRLKTVE